MQRNIIYLFVSLATFLIGNIIAAPWSTANRTPAYHAEYTSAEQELLTIERRYLDAHMQRDVATLDSILADDFTISYPFDRVGDKAARLSLVADSDFTFIDVDTFDVDVEVNGDEGVVIGRAVVTGSDEGRVFRTPPYRFMRRYEKRQGRWQIVSVQFGRDRR
jgi:ketosteroid isomerase-like protein